AVGMAFSGCISINNEEDFKQTVGEVNIAWDSEKIKSDFSSFTEQQMEKVFTTKTIIKRDLLISSLGGQNSSFQTILDNLVENTVITQYSTAKLIENRIGDGTFNLDTYASKTTDIEKYEYLLGENSKEVKNARYSRDALLNTTLDGYEKNHTDKKDDDYVGTDSRAVPSGIDTFVEDYIPNKYNIYTGYGDYTKGNAGEDYEGVDGTNKYTRQLAVADLVSALERTHLITAEDRSGALKEHDVLSLSYVKEVYTSYLESEIVDKYSDIYVNEKKAALLKTGMVDGVEVYVNIKDEYDNEIEGELTKQANKYTDQAAFESAVSGISDTSFVLYSPELKNTNDQFESESANRPTRYRYGYVYNILLPFSKSQETKLAELQNLRNKDLITDSDYFAARNDLLREIETYDRRDAWFNGATDYSFDAKDVKPSVGGVFDYFRSEDPKRSGYLFFENNVKTNAVSGVEKYEKLTRYFGKYGYNGRVTKNDNGSYTLVPNKLDIDDMLDEFCAYIDYALGNPDGTTKSTIVPNDGYYTTSNFTDANDKDKIDYSKLVYATGKVDVAGESVDMFNPALSRYNAMAAVNELQYAYTTDTGVLSQFIGYSVTPYSTSYIKEFEYAAQEAIANGVGSFSICAGDYGWHLIYVTEVYNFANPEGGAIYKPNWSKADDRINKKGTFEYNFYNWKKDTILASESSLKRSAILYDFNSDTTAKLYEDAYKDLI
ncbi:MAG: hypothetical protein K2N47_03830, partial [Clostridia bacterium]|nr:hypothetical protein [Clostridia bacterium]